mmetsp:Transcript_21914/g.58656  ORF Transcript_21914/g.58656 Transcript_21914/m.58656 type:complete len:202 (-) Transcript_21914:1736-2341(-)
MNSPSGPRTPACSSSPGWPARRSRKGCSSAAQTDARGSLASLVCANSPMPRTSRVPPSWRRPRRSCIASPRGATQAWRITKISRSNPTTWRRSSSQERTATGSLASSRMGASAGRSAPSLSASTMTPRGWWCWCCPQPPSRRSHPRWRGMRRSRCSGSTDTPPRRSPAPAASPCALPSRCCCSALAWAPASASASRAAWRS